MHICLSVCVHIQNAAAQVVYHVCCVLGISLLWSYATVWLFACGRGLRRSLWVGVLIALPSGAGVALSILGGNTGSLVGVAISASLLPPAVNAVSSLSYHPFCYLKK